jgi:hypothetical protein
MKTKVKNYWGISIRHGVRHFVLKHTPWPDKSRDAEQHSKNIAERFWVADSFLDMRNEKTMVNSYIKRLGEQLK